MSDDQDLEAAIRAMVESVARARGYAFGPHRLAAVIPEVRRLHELVRRLRALPIDEEPPAGRFTPS